jgi:tetratricopeptide (TPR) repeat protein
MRKLNARTTDATSVLLHPSFEQGALAQALEQRRNAIRHYRNEIRKTGYWKAHFNLAWLLAATRRSQAVRHYQRAIQNAKGPRDRARGWQNLGGLWHRMGCFRPARAAYLKAHRLEPDDQATVLNLALLFFEFGRPALGTRWLRRWSPRRSGDPDDDKLGAYLMVTCNVDVRKGVTLLKRALAQQPHDPVVLADLALGHARLGDREMARALARKARRTLPERGRSRRLVLGSLDRLRPC